MHDLIEIDKELGKLGEQKKRAQNRLSSIIHRMEELEGEKRRRRDADDVKARVKRDEEDRDRRLVQDRIAQEAQKAEDAVYEREPAVMARLQKITKERGFVIGHKFDGEEKPYGIKITFPYGDPDVDLLEKYGHEPTVFGAAEFFEILHRPRRYTYGYE